MLKELFWNILFDYIKGKHSTGQIFNLGRYFFGRKKSILTWEPIYLSIFLTYRCNLRCDMCLTHSNNNRSQYGQKPTKDIDFELFKEVLNKYKNALVVNLIGNGEPLLHKDLFRMIEYAADTMKMYTFSVSNGILLGEYLDKLVASPLTHLTVSLNGHNPSEFNRMTGMDQRFFTSACENTRMLIRERNIEKSNLEVWVSIILDQENYRYLNEMIRFAESLGADGVVFGQFLPTEKEGFTADERCLFSDNHDVLRAFRDAKSIKPKLKILLPPLLERAKVNKSCSVYFYNLSVDGEGNVGGCCCQLLDLSGNGKISAQSPWNNEHFREIRRRFLEPTCNITDPCKYCYNNLPAKASSFRSLARNLFRRSNL